MEFARIGADGSLFQQLDGSDTRRHGGLGLDLYIVRRRAEQLGGSVCVESRVGEGSTFTLELPCTPLGTSQAPREHDGTEGTGVAFRIRDQLL